MTAGIASRICHSECFTVGWSRASCVTASVGNVHFTYPVAPGETVEVHARLIHTGRTSMQVLISVETSNVRTQSNAVDRLVARREIHQAMRHQVYSAGGSTPRTVFRFLADPADADYGGNVHGAR